MSSHRQSASHVRVAVCIAGALRSFEESWRSIERNLIEPTGAHVYVVASHEQSAAAGVRRGGMRDIAPANLTSIVETLGPSLRGAAIWGDDDLTPSSIARWAGDSAANASAPNTQVVYSWRYYLKRWACNALVAASPDGPYDVVVTMRPDLTYFRPWRFHRSHGGHAHGGANHSTTFQLIIGDDPPIAFGENEVVMHQFTFACCNDWVAVSTFAASTTLEQLVHHLYPAKAFAPCQSMVNHAAICCERLLSAYLWRIGMRRELADLHVEMTRKLPQSGAAMNLSSPAELVTYEQQHRRVQVGQDGLPSRNTGANRDWQWYCNDALFGEFGDGYVVEPCKAVEGSEKHKGVAAPGALWPMCSIHVHGPSAALCKPVGNDTTSLFPPCTERADLRQPLPACARGAIESRMDAAAGYGIAFEWWHACAGLQSCEPLRNAMRVDRDGSMRRLDVLPPVAR